MTTWFNAVLSEEGPWPMIRPIIAMHAVLAALPFVAYLLLAAIHCPYPFIAGLVVAAAALFGAGTGFLSSEVIANQRDFYSPRLPTDDLLIFTASAVAGTAGTFLVYNAGWPLLATSALAFAALDAAWSIAGQIREASRTGR